MEFLSLLRLNWCANNSGSWSEPITHLIMESQSNAAVTTHGFPQSQRGQMQDTSAPWRAISFCMLSFTLPLHSTDSLFLPSQCRCWVLYKQSVHPSSQGWPYLTIGILLAPMASREIKTLLKTRSCLSLSQLIFLLLYRNGIDTMLQDFAICQQQSGTEWPW